MAVPRFLGSLHFRLAVLFLLLAAVSFFSYWHWVRTEIFTSYDDGIERDWYEGLAAAEIDSVAAVLSGLAADPDSVRQVLLDYGGRVAEFEAEFIVFDAAGRHLHSCRPDSLAEAVPRVEPALLQDMSDGDWDFDTYPDARDVNTYVNRLFHVARVPATGYLAASYRPVILRPDEVRADERSMLVGGLVLLLAYAICSALILMMWTSRRLSRLSAGVEAFSAGDLERRVPARGTDEISVLGHHINTMAARIADMVEDLRRNEQLQRQLVANVSHDLRTPLTGLRVAVETFSLRGERMDPDERRRYLDMVTERLDHLDRLIGHALLLSRLDAGQSPFAAEDFVVGELTESVVARLEPVAARRGVELVLDLADDLPPVHADPLQIGRVLQNLAENGIRFTPAGGRVELAARRDADGVRITVRDTGCGIATEDLPHISERFYTGDKSRTARRDDDGTGTDALDRSSGLGLAIVGRILEGHAVDLEVTSRPGAGASFTFVLPRSATA